MFIVIVAEGILQAGSLKYLDGTTMKVSRQRTQSEPNDNLTKGSFQKSNQLETRTIEVSGLPTTVSQEFLQLFFENDKNGGGTVEDIKLQGKSALVTFQNSSGKYIVVCTCFALSYFEVLTSNVVFHYANIFWDILCLCATRNLVWTAIILSGTS